GVLLTLFCVGLFALVRRARRLARSAPPAPAASDLPAGFEEALCALAAAAAEPDVQRAADCAALALRRFASHHFRAPTRAATTPELRTTPAPYLMHARWPAFLGLLEGLDEVRFRPDATLREVSVRSQVQAAEAFVRNSAPAGLG
ncbi:MAG TPA: hypothetical protein VKE73_05055, partial [Myxococcota bacterium]|nr:hypothetical protein [Myxococcota bacterium]